ncbi:MAG: protein kinase, partial [Anaerolineae bacterium]
MTDVGKSFGKYRIVDELGRGGFATVYKALDTGLGLNREVALKVLHSHLAADPGFISRFQREAQVTAKLFHPQIALLLEAGEIEGTYYLAMQYIAGRNLRDLVRDQGLLPLDSIVTIIEQIGAALDFAHSRGVIHRDVKPGNIIVDDDLRATLTDFGIVKALEGTTLYTTSGAVWGTPSYVSPEQATSGVLDGRSDLYSLGVVAYELCTGRAPFVADTTPSLYYKIVHEAPPASALVHPRATGPLQAVLAQALAKAPEQRYASGREFADALRAAVREVQHETVQQLVAQARTSLAQAEFDAAEAALKQALAIRADDAQAQHLLPQVAERRELSQRYAALAQTVAQARTAAADLAQRDPHLQDPAGALALFARPAVAAAP